MTLDVDHLLSALTLAEKVALTSGSGLWWTAPVERLDIPRIMVADGPHGLRCQPEEGHGGLGSSLPATCFPTASALASSWNPDLLRRVGAAIGQEARASGVSVVLGPGINMKRSPLCGRNFEYYSEDPYLAGELAVGFVSGVQSTGVGAAVKHYAANNQETDRLRVDAQVDERTLREIYLPAFERVVRGARPWMVMGAYNKVNGVSVSENAWLLTTVLRAEFGFEGLVVSDWGAVYDRVAALHAGTDLGMPPDLERSVPRVIAAVESGEMPMKVLDAAARRVLELVDKGMAVLDLPEAGGADALEAQSDINASRASIDIDAPRASVDVAAHHALARAAAAEAVVLLKNEGRLLPLTPGTKVAVIGEFGRTPRIQGAGSSQVNPTRVDVAVDELAAAYDVIFAPGYRLADGTGTVAANDIYDSEGLDDEEMRTEAVRAARAADVAVVFLGLPGSDESEGFDRTHLNLPAAQLDVLRAVAAANPQVVVVLVNGGTVVLGEVIPHAKGLVEIWLGGQAAAGGLTDVLSGAVNPSGRLAETIPHRLADCPSYLHFPGDSQVVRYGEGLFIGYRGYDAAQRDVAFPFGFGLSYTTFDLSGLSVSVSGSLSRAVDRGDLAVRVDVTVTNTGAVAGAEVVQVYVRDPEASVARPVRELRGFAKVQLEPGESREVTIELPQRAFSWWSTLLDRWVVETGEFVIEVGHHSRDLPLSASVWFDAPPVTPPLTDRSTLHEWLADPDGRDLIAEAVAAGQPDPARDPEVLAVNGTMPMRTLAAFPGLSLDHTALDRAYAELRARRGG